MNWLPVAIIKYFTGAQPESVFQPSENSPTFGGGLFLVATVLVIIFSSLIVQKWQ